MKRVLVLAAHPDDEILECGGTIAKLARSGEHEVHAVVVCEGESLRYVGMNVDQASARVRAAKILGYSSIRCLGFPDQKLDTFSLVDINKKIEAVCDELQPEIVFTHWRGDQNRDHQIVAESAAIALRPVAEYVKEIYAFCHSAQQLPGLPPFQPNVWVDIEDTLPVKLEAFSQYTSELRPWPHARSLEALEHQARNYGVACNRNAAECFYLVRRMM